MLRLRPFVFISSAISGLEDLREAIGAGVEALGLADEWRFEIHATSGGEPADAQYLDLARSCDLMILVLGPDRSQATEDEYHEAYADNRDKVLPFYLGPAKAIPSDIRKLIDSRHSRIAAKNQKELAEKAIEAVRRGVIEARVVIRSLRESLEDRLQQLDQLLDLEPPLSFMPRLRDLQSGDILEYRAALGLHERLAVEGPGGSGKTYGALVALHQLSPSTGRRGATRTTGKRGIARDRGLDVVIPLLLRAQPGVADVKTLITAALEALRFFPGQELIERYAHEGRLVLAVDGYDSLASVERGVLLRSLESFCERFPRTQTILLARSLPDQAVPRFHRLAPAQLVEAQLIQLFESAGSPIRHQGDVPDAVVDLVGWPFWAGALARHGLGVSSGLELVRHVITRRVGLAAPGEPLRADKLREALSALALDAHPADAIPQAAAVESADRWQRSEAASRRFEAEPATQLVEALRGTGLVSASGSDLAFIHPLIAATLAAESVAAGMWLPPEAADELNVFSAALMSDDQAERLLELLVQEDIFFLARVLRVSFPRSRKSSSEEDVRRYVAALRRLSRLVRRAPGLTQESVTFAKGPRWLALRHNVSPLRDDGLETDAAEVANYEALVAGADVGEISLWEDNPFAAQLPELTAAGEVLFRFKAAFLDLRPSGYPYVSPDQEDDRKRVLSLVRNPEALEPLVFERLHALRDFEAEQRAVSGLDRTGRLPPIDGEAKVVVRAKKAEVRVEHSWGHEQRAFELLREEPEYRGLPLVDLLAGSLEALSYDRLKREVEETLGSALGSGAWNKPRYLAGWIW